MKLVLKAGALICLTAAVSTGAWAYDYVADVLTGNTVEVSNLATGKTSVFKLKADKTVERTMDGATVVGTWSVEGGKICAVYPGENNAQPQCSDIPHEPVQVPSERETEVPNPAAGQPPVRLKIKYVKGQ